MLPQYQGSEHLEVATKWYSGTDTLQEGYNLCYDTSLSPNQTTSIGGAARIDNTKSLGGVVVKPAAGNLHAFAGTVTGASAGRTGPCWVDIFLHRKHGFLKALTLSNMTANNGAATTALKLVAGQYYLSTDGAAGVAATVALAGETVDTSGGALNKYVFFV